MANLRHINTDLTWPRCPIWGSTQALPAQRQKRELRRAVMISVKNRPHSRKMLLTVANPGTFKPVAIWSAISLPGNCRSENDPLSWETPTWLRKSILGPEDGQYQQFFPEPRHHLGKIQMKSEQCGFRWLQKPIWLCTSISASRSMMALSWNFGLMAKGNPNLGEMST